MRAIHSSHSLRSVSTLSPFFSTKTIRPSRLTSTRSTSVPAFRAARSARVRSVSLNVAGPCPIASPMRPLDALRGVGVSSGIGPLRDLGQYADRGAVLGDHLEATDGEPSGSGAAHGAGHITLLEEVATTTDY